MGWFSSKSKQQVIEVAVSHNVREQKIKWVRETSQLDIIKKFNEFDFSLRNTFRETSLLEKEKTAFHKALDALTQIRNSWFAIDRMRANEQSCLYLFQVFNVEIPKVISQFQYNVIAYPYVWKAWEEQSSAEFSNIVQILSTLKEVESLTVLPSSENSVKENRVFPVFKSDNSEVETSLSRLKLLWCEAVARKNSVEDEFFLEQMAESYLPDAYQMYSTFRSAPESLQIQAKQLFLEQVTLMEQRLVHILHTVMTQNLTAMQSQVDFLRQRTEVDSTQTDSQLALFEKAEGH